MNEDISGKALMSRLPQPTIAQAARHAARDGKPVDFYAINHGDWWTIQTMCGPTHRAYAIEKATGALFELPDDRCPFAVLTWPPVVTSTPDP